MIVALFADKHTATMVAVTLADVICFAAIATLIVRVLP